MEEVIEIIDTKITDKWGVDWNEMETVRDFLQNFYDSNRVKDVTINISEGVVEVSAPSLFDYQELVYLGSDKSLNPEMIGQYGEGWKASVLNALRNFNCTVEMIINDKKLSFYFEDKKIGKTFKRVVFCKVLKHEPINKSILIIGNCSETMIQEFKFGLKYFYHDNNPLIGELIESNYEGTVGFYKSTDTSGYMFYKKLLRARLDIPLVVVCNKPYHHIEIKIKHDRDRKAFNDEVTKKFLKIVCKAVNYKKDIVFYLKDYWTQGHKVLSTLAEYMPWRGGNIQFPENYYAVDVNQKRPDEVDKKDYDLIIETDKVEKEFKANGYFECPNYMSKFGMKTPSKIAKERLNDRLRKHLKTNSRTATVLEKNALNLLTDVIRIFSSQLYNKANSYNYVISDSDEIVQNLKANREKGEFKIFLNKTFFTFDFSDALITLLREWEAVIDFGYHNKFNFKDFYINLVTELLKNKETVTLLSKYETSWSEAILKIVAGNDFIQVDTSFLNNRRKKLTKARKLFVEGRIEEVIEFLKEISNDEDNISDELLLLAEQHNSWKKGYIQGTEEYSSPLINRVKKNILELINSLGKSK